ncbi:hypothetical protein AA313_de0207630 [Arthrobotrys entomopaga]|nr:hypothetical protein AA313_de0207630 [Arthrobotrys entomopaga]
MEAEQVWIPATEGPSSPSNELPAETTENNDGGVSAQAARSCEVTFYNGSDVDLSLRYHNNEGGMWAAVIKSKLKATWRTESNGFMTGTDSKVCY